MPVYEYECLSCGKVNEVSQRVSDGPQGQCPFCGGAVRKLISNTSFVLKGSGWYVTDYARKSGNGEKKKNEGADKVSVEKKKDEGAGEVSGEKTDKKAESHTA